MNVRTLEKAAPTRWGRAFFALGLTALMLLMAFLTYATTKSADDFWYSVFLSGGIKRFISLNVKHYQQFNGRVWVHVVAQIILYAGNWLFALIAMLIVVLLTWCVSRTQKLPFLPIAVLVLSGFLVMPLQMLTEGVLWISAFCNYVLPAALLMGEVCLFAELERRGATPLRSVLLILVAFLCGASTEQTGLTAVGITLLFTLHSLRVKKSVSLLLLFCSLFTILGVITIFVSPATQGRVSAEVELLGSLRLSLQTRADLCFEGWNILVILLAFLLLAAACATRGKALFLRLLSMLFPFVLLFGYIAGMPVFSYECALVLLLVTGMIFTLCPNFLQAYLPVGMLCFAMVLSEGVMLFTQSNGYRTQVPLYLYLVVALAIMVVQTIPRKLWPYVSAVLLGVALLVRLPQISGFYHNWQTERQNQVYAQDYQETGILYYSMDYDSDYTHAAAFTDGYFWQTYLDSVGFDEVTGTYYVYSSSSFPLWLNETLLSLPALDLEGTLYLPLRLVLETAGGTVDITGNGLLLSLNGTDYTYYEGTLSWTDTAGDVETIEFEAYTDLAWTYYPASVFTEVFGFSLKEEMSEYILISE